MTGPFGSKTLQVTPAVLKTPALIPIFLVILVLVAEAVLRQPIIQAQLPPPSLGSTNIELDLKVPLIDALARSNGLDCIFIGNSSVEFSIRPELFQQAYKAQTGQNIHCFNFGLRGSLPTTHASLAEWLTETYHPKLLIIGEYVSNYYNQIDVLGNSPWLQYQTHIWNLEGWLMESSRLAQYYSRWAQMMAPDYPGSLNDNLLQYYAQHPLAADGYFGVSDMFHTKPQPGFDLRTPPDTNEYARFANLGQFSFNAVQVSSIKRYSPLQSSSTQIVFIESPVHTSFTQFFSGGDASYEEFRQELAGYVRSNGFAYWTTDEQPVIADNGWHDRNHLNAIGAGLYSTWLGETVGKAVTNKTLNTLSP